MSLMYGKALTFKLHGTLLAVEQILSLNIYMETSLSILMILTHSNPIQIGFSALCPVTTVLVL